MIFRKSDLFYRLLNVKFCQEFYISKSKSMMQIPEVKEKGKLSFYFSKNPDVVSMKYVNSRSERNGKVAIPRLQTMNCHLLSRYTNNGLASVV